MKDPIVEEIRKIRLDVDKEIQSNPEKFDEEIRSIQERYKERLVTFPPKSSKKFAA